MKKILMVVAQDVFRDEEYIEPRHFWEAQGAEVQVASSSRRDCQGRFGATAPVDLLLEEVDPTTIDALIFVGGGGASEYFDNPIAHSLALEAFASGKVVGAICIAPVILARSGLLKGKKATVFPDGAPDLEAGGAQFTGVSVEVHGQIVTGNGPQAANPFAQAVWALLEGEK